MLKVNWPVQGKKCFLPVEGPILGFQKDWGSWLEVNNFGKKGSTLEMERVDWVYRGIFLESYIWPVWFETTGFLPSVHIR